MQITNFDPISQKSIPGRDLQSKCDRQNKTFGNQIKAFWTYAENICQVQVEKGTQKHKIKNESNKQNSQTQTIWWLPEGEEAEGERRVKEVKHVLTKDFTLGGEHPCYIKMMYYRIVNLKPI